MSWKFLHAAINKNDQPLALQIIQMYSIAKKQLPDVKLEGLQDPADIVNYRDPSTGMTAATLAANKGQIKILYALLKSSGFTSEAYKNLIEYCNNQNPKLINMLQEALVAAIGANNLNFLKIFLTTLPIFDLTKPLRIEGMPPLHLAAYLGHKESVELLLEQKVQVNVQAVDQNGLSVVLCAVSNSNKPGDRLAIVQKLIEQGVPIDLPSKDEITPIVFAERYGLNGAVKALQEAKAELPKIIPAAALKNKDLFSAYLKLGVDPNMVVDEKTGDTALLHAVRFKIMLSKVFQVEGPDEKGVVSHRGVRPDFTKTNKNRETVLRVAFNSGVIENVGYILKANPELLVDDEILYDALSKAQQKNQSLLFLLLENPERIAVVDGELLERCIYYFIENSLMDKVKLVEGLLAIFPADYIWRRDLFSFAARSSPFWFKYFCERLQPKKSDLIPAGYTDVFFELFGKHYYLVACSGKPIYKNLHNEQDILEALKAVPGLDRSYFNKGLSYNSNITKFSIPAELPKVQQFFNDLDKYEAKSVNVSKVLRHVDVAQLLVVNPVLLSQSQGLLVKQLFFIYKHGDQQQLRRFCKRILEKRCEIFIAQHLHGYYWKGRPEALVLNYLMSGGSSLETHKKTFLECLLSVMPYTVASKLDVSHQKFVTSDPKLKEMMQRASLIDLYFYFSSEEEYADEKKILQKIRNIICFLADSGTTAEALNKVNNNKNYSKELSAVLKRLLPLSAVDAKREANDPSLYGHHLKHLLEQFVEWVRADEIRKKILDPIMSLILKHGAIFELTQKLSYAMDFALKIPGENDFQRVLSGDKDIEAAKALLRAAEVKAEISSGCFITYFDAVYERYITRWYLPLTQDNHKKLIAYFQNFEKLFFGQNFNDQANCKKDSNDDKFSSQVYLNTSQLLDQFKKIFKLAQPQQNTSTAVFPDAHASTNVAAPALLPVLFQPPPWAPTDSASARDIELDVVDKAKLAVKK